jgi:cytochrome P450
LITTQADWYKVMALPDHRYQTPMSEVDPKRQVMRAKNIASAFTLSNLLKAEKQMDDLIELFHTRLEQFADNGSAVEFDKWFNYLAFDIVGEMTFSSSFGFVQSGKDIGGAIENTRVLTLYTALAGFFYTLHSFTVGNPFVTKLGLMPAQHIFDTTLRAIEKRKLNPEVRYDMIEHWKQVLVQHPERMNETEFYGVANMTIGAGADTISASLQALFYYLLRNPSHLEKVKAEVRGATTVSKIISFSETQNMPFLQACVSCPLRDSVVVYAGINH